MQDVSCERSVTKTHAITACKCLGRFKQRRGALQVVCKLEGNAGIARGGSRIAPSKTISQDPTAWRRSPYAPARNAAMAASFASSAAARSRACSCVAGALKARARPSAAAHDASASLGRPAAVSALTRASSSVSVRGGGTAAAASRGVDDEAMGISVVFVRKKRAPECPTHVKMRLNYTSAFRMTLQTLTFVSTEAVFINLQSFTVSWSPTRHHSNSRSRRRERTRHRQRSR